MKRFCTVAAGLFLGSTFVLSAAQADETINYVTAGGVYLQNITKAFLDPIGKKLGVKWSIETSDEDTPVRIQFKSGNVTTDIVEFGASTCARGAREGMYEKLDFKVIDVSDFAPGSYTDYYIGSTVFSIVMAWNPKTVKTPPQSWADFWNVEKFPGTRALRRSPRATLEIALLADGVPMDKLYPLDMDRAFASLRKIKPHIKAWWLSGAESQQLIRDGGIDMMPMFNARVESVIADKGSAAYTFNQGLIDFGCWAIVTGSPKKALAMKILAEFAKPEYQTEMTLLSNYGAANTAIAKTGRIPASLLPKLPTSPENVNRQVVMSGEWWAANGAKAQERFDQFMTE